MRKEKLLIVAEIVGMGMFFVLYLNVALVFGWDVNSMDYLDVPLLAVIWTVTGIVLVIDIVLQVKNIRRENNE